ncbi:MAG: thioredoxin family protein, partial [Verrucomicrobiota bacterium]
MKRIFLSLFPVLLGPFLGQAQEESPAVDAWFADYNEAVAEAKASQRDLLIVFTGTDWIEICQIFYDEILSAPEFIDSASKAFVLLKLEYPKNNRLPREEAIQKQLLRDAYRVRGFPTVVYTTADGVPYGINGYQPVTPEKYAEVSVLVHAAGKARREIAAEAESLEGLEKAEKLVESIPDLPGNLIARYYREALEEILDLDPEDTLGRQREYTGLIGDVEYANRMQALSRESRWSEMIGLTDEYIERFELEGPPLQKALLNKAGVQRRQDNAVGMIETLLAIVKVDPESSYGVEAQKQLDTLRADRLT